MAASTVVSAAAASTAPVALPAPKTTTAANHTSPRTGSKASGSKAWEPRPSSPPPRAASAAPTVKASSLSRGTFAPAARAAGSWSRTAPSALPVRPFRSARTSSSAAPSSSSSTA